ncbi:oxidoreductase [Pullulanibacillus camelliae]|uniref:Oxidoreductase n=1 Tax=Pullulanibacillus camelliae TaxID=1707096 RepID=A0A8J2VLC3_9BACL|nr:Gfo/Idh/MocA family oxidoreductase [Pullulanibacillus camelliae]GGE31463.1 oxidoreductase [Pullulanibacillus camelliae]
MKEFNVALIGYNFMGKVHSYAMNNVSFFFDNTVKITKKVIVGRTEHLVKQAAETYGWEAYATDWRQVIERADIDIVIVATPTASHMEIAVTAVKAGKHVLCEKPLGLNADQAKEMLDAAKRAQVVHMLGHNYRRVPAVSLMRKLIEEGKLGDIYHFRGVYLQDWLTDPSFPVNWKLKKEVSGSGPHGDLNSHLIDLARFLIGEIDRVVGMKKTFIKKRPKVTTPQSLSSNLHASSDAERWDEVTVEDANHFLAEFKCGAMGTFESSRLASGRKNHEGIEINGSKGSMVFNFERMNELHYWSKDDAVDVQGFRTILVTEDVHPYIQHWWPPGHIIGYQNTFVNQFADFIQAIVTGEEASPNFYDGWQGNKVLDAVTRSVHTLTWENVE